ncbi:MAG TPA: hypothetical protein PKK10_11160 [Woeseiaceae bacterium]|nr:hypothetical protein [Woeseiaceae bacterium]
MFVFASANSGYIEVDLLFARVKTSIPVAFAVTVAIGWMFGLLCTAIWALRLVNERRALRRALRLSESEVSSLRKLPLNDAD